MKRLPALLALVVALVLVLMLGAAGVASATTLTFDDGRDSGAIYIIPAGSPIASVTYVRWSDDGGGHLYCNNSYRNNIIYFTDPTYVNSFQITGMPSASYNPYDAAPVLDDPNFIPFGPVTITAFSLVNQTLVPVWSTTIDFAQENPDDPGYPVYGDWSSWLTVDVNTADVSQIIFYGSNPSNNPEGPFVYPSIDNLVINETAVPIPASAWLLVSGLLGLVGLRRKFSC